MIKDRFTALQTSFRSPATKSAWPLVFVLPPAEVILNAGSVSSWGSDFFAFIAPFCTLPLMATLPCLFLLPFWFFSRRYRSDAFAWWLVCVIHAPLAMGALFWGESIRSDAFHQLASRSGELVRAIKAYEVDQASPPDSLEQLVPKYLPSIPGTGMRAYPSYRYLSIKDVKSFEGNPWILKVDCFTGSFDTFYYFPLQNYPKHGYGGTFERMHDWAYLHE